MKKITLLVVLALIGILPSKAQSSIDCSNAERILLNERPSGVSERTAYTVIKKQILATSFNKTELTEPTQTFWPRAYGKIYYDIASLEKADDPIGYRWKVTTSVYSGDTPESTFVWLIVWWVICFFVGMVVSWFINHTALEFNQKPLGFCITAIIICLFGSIIGYGVALGGVGNDGFKLGATFVDVKNYFSVVVAMLSGITTNILRFYKGASNLSCWLSKKFKIFAKQPVAV